MASIDNKIKLIIDSLYELAEHVGDSLREPKSLSLLLLSLGLNLEDKGKILLLFKKISVYEDLESLDNKDIYILFRERLTSIIPEAENYDDIVIFALIRAYAKDFIENLYPLSSRLQGDFS